MEEDVKRYKLLCKEVKHSINYIGDFYCFDFENFENIVNEMKELQEKIIKDTINYD